MRVAARCQLSRAVLSLQSWRRAVSTDHAVILAGIRPLSHADGGRKVIRPGSAKVI